MRCINYCICCPIRGGAYPGRGISTLVGGPTLAGGVPTLVGGNIARSVDNVLKILEKKSAT